METLKKLKVNELREILKINKKSIEGKRMELIQRIINEIDWWIYYDQIKKLKFI